MKKTNKFGHLKRIYLSMNLSTKCLLIGEKYIFIDTKILEIFSILNSVQNILLDSLQSQFSNLP